MFGKVGNGISSQLEKITAARGGSKIICQQGEIRQGGARHKASQPMEATLRYFQKIHPLKYEATCTTTFPPISFHHISLHTDANPPVTRLNGSYAEVHDRPNNRLFLLNAFNHCLSTTWVAPHHLQAVVVSCCFMLFLPTRKVILLSWTIVDQFRFSMLVTDFAQRSVENVWIKVSTIGSLRHNMVFITLKARRKPFTLRGACQTTV